MAGKTREIRNRIKAVGNIQRITKTMQMIATARFQASQRRAMSAQPYTRKIAELVGQLAAMAQAEGEAFSHPLLTAPKPSVGRQLLLVLTSNRGLCGGYNASALRTAAAYLRAHGEVETDLEVVGKKGMGYFRFTGRKVQTAHSHFGDKPEYVDVERLAQQYMERFAQGQYDSIHVLFTAFESMSRQTPRVLQLLPLKDPGGQARPLSRKDFDFAPEPIALLSELLPISVKTQLFQCFNESVVSEQIARMVAMKAATDNAGQMRKRLTRAYNRARQTAITTELMEVIGGAAALG